MFRFLRKTREGVDYDHSFRWKNQVQTLIKVVAAIAGLFTAGYLIDISVQQIKPSLPQLLLVFWGLVPPFWFAFEYHLWRTKPVENRKSLEEFKFGQELSRNIWLAFVIVLAALYF